jgi:L-fuculose-phosphate aldolase
MTFEAQRKAICEVGKLLYDRGYVAANDGNISVKVAPDRLLITPSGVSKGRMTPDMLLVADLDGNVIEGDRHPSSEGKMHFTVYRHRPDVGAVVHAHPSTATAFSICRKPLKTPYLAELVLGLGEVPVTPEFAMLSTDEVPRSVEPYLADHNAVMLANHGVLTWGSELWQAFDRMETVEHTAKTLLNVERLGGGVPLSDTQVKTLISMRGQYKTLAQKTK